MSTHVAHEEPLHAHLHVNAVDCLARTRVSRAAVAVRSRTFLSPRSPPEGLHCGRSCGTQAASCFSSCCTSTLTSSSAASAAARVDFRSLTFFSKDEMRASALAKLSYASAFCVCTATRTASGRPSRMNRAAATLDLPSDDSSSSCWWFMVRLSMSSVALVRVSESFWLFRTADAASSACQCGASECRCSSASLSASHAPNTSFSFPSMSACSFSACSSMD